ncbi:MAG TPA: tyrosine-type recombinase/integrase, partial [Terriglobales bacterium]
MANRRDALGIRDYDMTRIGTFCAIRSAELFGLRWEGEVGRDLLIQNSAWEGMYERHTKKAKPRKVAMDGGTREALARWRKVCPDTRPQALMFPSQKPGVPLTSRNWLRRNPQPIGKMLGIRTPLTFQVLRRTYATHNQRQLKNVQAHLGHENPLTTANLYVVEVPPEVRRTQARHAMQIDKLRSSTKMRHGRGKEAFPRSASKVGRK